LLDDKVNKAEINLKKHQSMKREDTDIQHEMKQKVLKTQIHKKTSKHKKHNKDEIKKKLGKKTKTFVKSDNSSKSHDKEDLENEI